MRLPATDQLLHLAKLLGMLAVNIAPLLAQCLAIGLPNAFICFRSHIEE